ncbi:MAG: hypothetical protein RR051_05225, partial [Clostridiales bacterium]
IKTKSHGSYVSPHTAQELTESGAQTFLAADGLAGVAVWPGGNIGAVFKNGQLKTKDTADDLVLTALSNGGNKLDNFDGNLSNMYSKYGFIPVAKVAFNPEYAPEGWNYEKFGQPDVIFWMHNGDSPETVAAKIGDYPRQDTSRLPIFPDYDAAYAYRDSLQQRGMAKNSIPKAVAAGVEGMAEVQAELSPESQVYTPESLETSQQKGLDYIREQGGVEQANSQTLSQMRERHSLNTTEQVAAVELVKYYAQDRNPGDRQKAVALTEVLMETATEMGRAINALKLLQKNTPEGLLAFANQYIKKLQDPKVKLTNQDQANLTSLGKLITGWDTLSNLSVEERNSQIDAVLAETQASPNLKGWVKKALNEKGIDLEDALTAKAMDLIANKSPSTWRQKFRALQRSSMLSNPKTHGRNVMGNAVVTAGETLAHPISWLADTALSKMTGQRTHAAIKGNDVVKGISDGINKANVQRRLGIDLEGHQRYQEGGGQLQPKAFNPELANNWLSKGALTFLDKVDGIISTALNYGDTGFFHGYYQDALGQMMRANKVSEATPEMLEAASESALRRVFQDDNAVT